MIECLPHIDYANPEEVTAYGISLCEKFGQEAGSYSNGPVSPSLRDTIGKGKVWLREVRFLIKDILSSVDLSPIPSLLQCYDLLHRVCYGAPAADYIREVRLKTTDSWVKGNKSISSTDIVLMLLAEVDRDIHTLDPRYARYALTMMEKWIEQLSANGRFDGISHSEGCRRVDYLLSRDLSVFIGRENQDRIKSRWASEYNLNYPYPCLN